MCEGEQQQPPRLNPLYRGGADRLLAVRLIDPLKRCQIGKVDVTSPLLGQLYRLNTAAYQFIDLPCIPFGMPY